MTKHFMTCNESASFAKSKEMGIIHKSGENLHLLLLLLFK